MAGETNFNMPGADAFGAFWSDFFGKMASAGVAPPQPSADMTERMRKAFFESFAKYADEFAAKRSEDDETVDGPYSVAAVDEPVPAKGRPGRRCSSLGRGVIGLLVRGMEDRVMDARRDE